MCSPGAGLGSPLDKEKSSFLLECRVLSPAGVCHWWCVYLVPEAPPSGRLAPFKRSSLSDPSQGE